MTKFTLFILTILCANLSFAQIDNITLSTSDYNSISTSYYGPFDNDQLYKDELNRRQSGRAPHFAKAIQTNINTDNAGNWETINGYQVWRLKIHSPGAKSLNFGFSEFQLPENGVLRFYEGTTLSSIRNFTNHDNEHHKQLWTPCFLGDQVVIELIIPGEKNDGLELTLTQIGHDFAGFMKSGGSGSGACNLDIICNAEEGWPMVDAYRDASRSVALISLGGVAFCSGFLINNTANDCTPYFMTAKHCGINAGNAASLVTYWNYEHSSCRPVGSATNAAPGNGNQNTFNTGSIWKAAYTGSDMTLVELDDPVHADANAYYAGWDRGNVVPTKGVAIHHPNAQEKRISFEDQSLKITNYLVTDDISNGDHLRVTDWDLGTTEGGSSGSPLFDENQRVVGQLHGGSAGCDNDLSDWYGRIFTSWDGGGSTNSSLSNWLDPLNTGQMTLDGIQQADNCNQPLVLNLMTEAIEVCLGQTPEFTVEMLNYDANEFNILFTGLPLGVTVDVIKSPLAGNSMIDVVFFGFQNSGTYTIELVAENEFHTAQIALPITINSTPGITPLVAPLNGQTEVPLAATLEWDIIDDANYFMVQIATDADFNNVIAESYVVSNTYLTNLPNESTPYYWTVTSINDCGVGAASVVRNFTTTSSINLSISPATQTACLNGEMNFQIQISENFSNNPLTLSILNLPNGATFTIDSNPISAGDIVNISVSNFQNAPIDLYNLSVTISDGNISDSVFATLILQNAPDYFDLLFPVNNENSVALNDLSLEWSEANDALMYQVIVALDQDFGNIVVSETTDVPFFTIESVLQSSTNYFWKIVSYNDCGQSSSPIRTFTTTTVTSVDEFSPISVSVFPNPASSNLSIEISENFVIDDLTLFTVAGQKVMENLNGLNHQTIDISNIPSGTYLLRVTSDEIVYTERIVIQH